jgi:hypothetical protein
MSLEYVIYTDESDRVGSYYSNFYGGVLVRSVDLRSIIDQMEDCKQRLNLYKETKWEKVSAGYLEKYVALMDEFFQHVAADRAKIRIMFTQNRFVPTRLNSEQRRTEYHRLYYQFLKHAFGLRYANDGTEPVYVRVNLDQMPENREDNAQFKAFLVGLNQNSQLRQAGIRFRPDQIAEVDSHDHVLLQCLDVVLGAMSFRLNDKHKQMPPGQRQRGKKTIAKEKLHEFIRARICQIYPRFNIGETTGKGGEWANLWHHPYRHWKFVPTDHDIDENRSKK